MSIEKYKTNSYEFLLDRKDEHFIIYNEREGVVYVCRLYPSETTKELIFNCLKRFQIKRTFI